MSTTDLSFLSFVVAVFLAGAAVDSCLARHETEEHDAPVTRSVPDGTCACP